MRTEPSVLFVRADSDYKTLGLDCWDAKRDARKFTGDNPVIVHPPCRSWGRLRTMSKHTPEERACAPWAVQLVRKNGGVLEHPSESSLWNHVGLPRPGKGFDEHGGFSIQVDQYWWGHRARKRTWLYICGCLPADVPPIPFKEGTAPCVITNQHGLRAGMPGYRPEVTKREREATPIDFAKWLVELAGRCKPSKR